MTFYDNRNPNLQVATINDFTPGIQLTQANITTPERPIGSASNAFRCYAVPGVGLCPFPTYNFYNTNPLAYPYTIGSSSVHVVSGMKSLGMNTLSSPGPSSTFDDIMISRMALDNTGNNITFAFNRLFNNASIIATEASYTSTGVGFPATSSIGFWGSMEVGLFQLSAGAGVAGLIRCGVCVDPIAVKWVTVPSNTTAGTINNSAGIGFTGGNLFYANSRIQIIPQIAQANGPTSSIDDYANIFFYPQLSMGGTLVGVAPTIFTPELGNVIGAWGSVSTGETFFVFSGGGACVVYGDIAAPQSAVSLPGVFGTGFAIGRAVPSQQGLIYVSDQNGAFIWNGGNTSQKISLNVPDNNFTRPGIPGTNTSIFSNVHHDVWNNWVFMANNWVYDQVTGSWWQCEDPRVLLFHVFCRSNAAQSLFYSADHAWTNLARNPANTLDLNVYQWQYLNLASSYSWTSNPIRGVPGALVEIQEVEIVASNPTSRVSTITITPTNPSEWAGVLTPTSFGAGNQNPNQPITFTIPPFARAARLSQHAGFTNWSMCVNVFAKTINGNAPILHELSLGFVPGPTSSV